MKEKIKDALIKSRLTMYNIDKVAEVVNALRYGIAREVREEYKKEWLLLDEPYEHIDFDDWLDQQDNYERKE